MKRLLALLMAVCMLLCLAACGGKADKPAEDTTATTTTEDATDSTTTVDLSDCTTTTDATTTVDTTAGTKAPTTTKKPTTTTAANEDDDDDDDGWNGWEPPIPPEVYTTTAPQPDNRPTIKILSIGHSFSVDAMRTYMWDLFEAAGYNTTIAYLFYPGCSLERQYHYITENQAAYQQYAKNTDGIWEVEYNARALTALWDEDWDIVTFQPSPDYGAGTMTYQCEWGCKKKVNDYDHFNALVQYVKESLEDKYNPHGPNTDVKFYYHLTWAFAEDCRLWSFGSYHDYNQMGMYDAFLAATKKYVLPNKTIQGVIPCITSIQNARTSWMGDTFNEPGENDPNKDGYHLNDKGDLVAAMTWVAYFSGKKAMDFKIGCKYTDAEYKAFAEAVDNAIAKWDSVTESSYKTQP